MQDASRAGGFGRRASKQEVVDTPTGIVTFLFTDIEGSTALHENHPTRMRAALERHDEILPTGS